MPQAIARLDSALIGAQGAYYVMARLAGLGWIPALTPRGTAGIDILAAAASLGGPQVRIQSKATSVGVRHGWPMNRKDENPTADFYAAVDLQPPVTIYVIPGEVVGRYLRMTHQAWLAKPGRRGQAHVDSPMRMLAGDPVLPDFPPGWLETYRENWNLLSAAGTGASKPPSKP